MITDHQTKALLLAIGEDPAPHPSIGSIDGEGVLRGIGKEFFFDYFTPSEYIGELVMIREVGLDHKRLTFPKSKAFPLG